MSLVVVWTCDRCGATATVQHSDERIPMRKAQVDGVEYHLCDDCEGQFLDWMLAASQVHA